MGLSDRAGVQGGWLDGIKRSTERQVCPAPADGGIRLADGRDPSVGTRVKRDPSIKHDTLKPRFELIDPEALLMLAMVLTSGAAEYEDDNWRHVDAARFIGAAHRHLNARSQGEFWDPKSGLPHSAHLMANAMFLCAADLAADLVSVEDVVTDWQHTLRELMAEKGKRGKAKDRKA